MKKVAVVSKFSKSPLRSSVQNPSLRKSYSSFNRSTLNASKVYNQDSVHVPSYYSRPGPGLYYDGQAGVGQKTEISKYTNAPHAFI